MNDSRHPDAGNTRQSDFDWSRFWVRFAFGLIPGALLGFGFWIQMCRPAYTLGWREHLPRLVTEWLGLETTIDTIPAGLIVIMIFSFVTGIIVAFWPSGSRHQ